MVYDSYGQGFRELKKMQVELSYMAWGSMSVGEGVDPNGRDPNS